MFCSKCGNQMQEGSLFCNNCGAPMSVNAPQNQPQNLSRTQKESHGYTNENGYTVTTPSFFNKIKPGRLLSKNTAVNTIKQSANSWPFFVFVIAMVIMALIKLVNVFSDDTILSQLDELISIFSGDYYEFSVSELLYEYLDGFYDVFLNIQILFKLIAFAPFAIALYGVVHFYISCLDDKHDGINLKGINILELLYRILLIAEIVLYSLADIALFVGAVAVGQDSFLDSLATALWILLAVLTIYFVFNLLFVKKVRDTLVSLRSTVINGTFDNFSPVSMYLIVWIFISCLSPLVSLGSEPLTSLVNLTMLISLNIAFIQFNKKLSLVSPNVRRVSYESEPQFYKEVPSSEPFIQPQPKPAKEADYDLPYDEPIVKLQPKTEPKPENIPQPENTVKEERAEKQETDYLDISLINMIQQKICALSVEETEERIAKLETLSNAKLSKKDRARLSFELSVCAAHLEDMLSSESKACPICGKELDADAAFCSKCGYRL